MHPQRAKHLRLGPQEAISAVQNVGPLKVPGQTGKKGQNRKKRLEIPVNAAAPCYSRRLLRTRPLRQASGWVRSFPTSVSTCWSGLHGRSFVPAVTLPTCIRADLPGSNNPGAHLTSESSLWTTTRTRSSRVANTFLSSFNLPSRFSSTSRSDLKAHKNAPCCKDLRDVPHVQLAFGKVFL